MGLSSSHDREEGKQAGSGRVGRCFDIRFVALRKYIAEAMLIIRSLVGVAPGCDGQGILAVQETDDTGGKDRI